MTMKNLPHPGDFIRTEIIEALGLSISKAADILKVRRATLSDLLAGKASLSSEMALRIEKAFGPDMDHLFGCSLRTMWYRPAAMPRTSASSVMSPHRIIHEVSQNSAGRSVDRRFSFLLLSTIT